MFKNMALNSCIFKNLIRIFFGMDFVESLGMMQFSLSLPLNYMSKTRNCIFVLNTKGLRKTGLPSGMVYRYQSH